MSRCNIYIILSLFAIINFFLINAQQQEPQQPQQQKPQEPQQQKPQEPQQQITTTSTTPPAPPAPTPDPNKYFKKPDKKLSDKTYAEDLTDFLFTGCWGKSKNDKSNVNNKCRTYRAATEYPGYNGWNNNIGKPELGAVDTSLLRKLPAAYEDGVNKPSGSNRPEPLEISEKLLSGKIGTKSKRGRNVLLVFFGQHVAAEIVDAQRPACPPEYFNINVTEDHPYRKEPGHTQMPFLRTMYNRQTGQATNNPRQQLNGVTPFLDGGAIYGTSKAWSNFLRTNADGILEPNGKLASSHSDGYPDINTVRLPMANPPPPTRHHEYVSQHHTESVTRFFKLGNPRGNENPFLLTFDVIWFKWHNVLATHIKRLNPSWRSDRIYNEARKWVIATQQHIVVDEWLPAWLGGDGLPKYNGYDSNIDPQIEQFFQTAAFRFGHTLVPSGVYLRNYGRNNCMLEPHPVRTCNNYWMSQNSLYAKSTKLNIGANDTAEKLVMGMAVQLCEEEDHRIVKDLRGSLYGPLEFSRRDLMALNVQRGRDHGVPDYNSARRAYGLHEVKSINHFTYLDDKTKQEFLRLYNNSLDDVDVWIGGLLETNDGPGTLFQNITRDQFQRIRDGDRFWYNNTSNKLFLDEEVDRLKQLKFYDILMCVFPKMEYNDIQKSIFRVPRSENDLHGNCKTIVKPGECKAVREPCFYINEINENIENCTKPGSYDYYSNSVASFIFTFLGVSIFLCGFIALLIFKIQLKEKGKFSTKEKNKKVYNSDNIDIIHSASEWQEPRTSLRHVILALNNRKKQLEVKNQLGDLIRVVDFLPNSNIMIYCTSDSHYAMIRVHHNYDLVLKFDSEFLRSTFVKAFEKFISEISTSENLCSLQMLTNITLTALLKQAITKKNRQKKLEMFFRVVFAQAFHITHTEEEMLQIDSMVARDVIHTELTIIEFAEALSMRPDSEFVKKIFNLADKDKNGFISFREFVDMLVIFLNGTAEQKMKFMFDMYDINGTGRLKREEFSNMLRSFMETSNADVTDDELEDLVQSMMYHADLADKETINLQNFQQILSDFNDKFNYAELEFNVHSAGKSRILHAGVKTVRSTFIGEVQKTVESLYADPSELQVRVEGNVESEQKTNEKKENRSEIIDKNEKIVEEPKKELDDYWYPIMKYIANKRLHIFWTCLYTLFLLGIFVERVYSFSKENASGLRQILGYGLAVTKGSAAPMMLAYSTLLVVMCNNTITFLRTTILQFYIPFDSAIEMHKYVACWALIFTVLHVVGHGFNFYHISTQTADDLTCLFRNYFHATHELPKFHYWCWYTITGVTGVLLTILTGLIFICSLSIVRKSFYNWFSLVHSLYPLFYIFTILHGIGRLVQGPNFHYYFLGPVILFTLDKVATATRKTIKIPILKAEILPSGVTCIIFPKPMNFQYLSGQWIRIACPALKTNECHPFTLSSAPHETNLSIHIRAVGPWTINIREHLELCKLSNKNLPVIHIDGPYGEGHQDWDKYKVSIMVGGGIGVTPFASVLKDIVFKSHCKLHFGCKKVYFLWVTRTQKQFEWMVDILRELEKADVNNTVSIHIFVTQFYQKFDLRTILLYICERHFQKISNKSLFTGLKAVTHFGRPKFSQFFTSIQKLHPSTSKIGVFSCGTPALTQAVDTACKTINIREINGTLFQHHYKSF
ncbi:dual oxidase-like [Pseudomyrmex gracilis]|uniref:dual oxidase-like n=1 Tax=Pseudomyrmex gracilis TaxID=219809 RepID=UPI00099565D4|nr:dual oxidase-like [Pseudomyrmex gracilis]